MIKPRPFMSSVVEISAAEAGEIPGLPETISYWTEGSCRAGEWFQEVNSLWGTAGFAVRRGEEFLGYAVYGPAERLPCAGRYPPGSDGGDAALLAYVCGHERVRRHLIVRSLRDLRSRGIRGLEAIACDREHPHHASTRFLLESGWRPVGRCYRAGGPYTRARVDLGSAAEVGEIARGLIDRVKLPRFGTPAPAPSGMSSLSRARMVPRQPEPTERGSRS